MDKDDMEAALLEMRREYGKLHDYVSEMVESGQIGNPGHCKALTRILVRCTAANERAGKALDAN